MGRVLHGLRKRWRVWHTLIWAAWWKKIILSGWFLVSLYSFISTQILPEKNLPLIGTLLPDWEWQIWLLIGLGLLLIILLEGIYQSLSVRSSKNWITDYQFRYGRLPSIPDHLLPVVINYEAKQPITKDIEIIPMSGQFWNRLYPTQKEELQQLIEWLGMNWDDYSEQMRRMLPPQLI